MSLLASVDNYNFSPRVSGLHVLYGLSRAAEREGPINDRNELAPLVQGGQDIQIRGRDMSHQRSQLLPNEQ